MMRAIATVMVLALATAWASGAGRPSKAGVLAFHLEGEETDNPKMVIPVKLGTDHRQYYFQKIPAFTERDVLWFYPFTSRDGASFGAAFRLKDHAASKLRDLTIANQGRLLGLRCVDAPLQAVLIDRPVEDGVVVVWEGLQEDHLKEFRKNFPHADEYAEQGSKAGKGFGKGRGLFQSSRSSQ